MNQHASPPSINSSSLCHLGPREGLFFLLHSPLCLIGLGMRRSLALSKRKRRGIWRKEWKESCCVNRLWQNWGEGTVQQLFLVVCTYVLRQAQCGQSWTMQLHSLTLLNKNTWKTILLLSSRSHFMPSVSLVWQAEEEVLIFLQEPGDRAW